MDHKLVLENSSSAAVNTLPSTTIYLKIVQYFNIGCKTNLVCSGSFYFFCFFFVFAFHTRCTHRRCIVAVFVRREIQNKLTKNKTQGR